MTAINFVAQPKHGCLHVGTDAAVYDATGIVHGFGTKVLTVPHWPGLITCLGNAAAYPIFGTYLALEFASFDDMIGGAEAMLPLIAEQVGLPTGADIILAGISAKRGPEAWMFKTDNRVPITNTREEAEASPFFPEPFKLVRLPNNVQTPVPADQVIPANFEGFDVDADPAVVVWTLRKMLEMQHRMELPAGVGGVGGFAQLTTISEAGISQRLLQKWPEDRIGQCIKAPPIDWARWHRENPKPKSADLNCSVGVIPLSRAERRRFERAHRV